MSGVAIGVKSRETEGKYDSLSSLISISADLSSLYLLL